MYFYTLIVQVKKFLNKYKRYTKNLYISLSNWLLVYIVFYLMDVGLTSPPAHGASGKAKMSVMGPVRPDASVKV